MGNAPSPRESDRPPDSASSQFLIRDRLRKLLQVAKGHDRALILTHDNPDPDAVASACGLAYLLAQSAGVTTTTAYGGIIGRAENKAMLKMLHLGIQPGSRIEHQTPDPGSLPDTPPEGGNHSLAPAAEVPPAVPDHPPARPAALRAA